MLHPNSAKHLFLSAINLDDQVQIENARQIIDTRNWVIHGYDKVGNVIVVGGNHFTSAKAGEGD